MLLQVLLDASLERSTDGESIGICPMASAVDGTERTPFVQSSIRSCLGRAASSCRPTLHGYCWLFSTDHQNTRMIAIGSSALAASYAYLYEYYREIVATGISMQNRLLLYIQTDHYSMGRQQ